MNPSFNVPAKYFYALTANLPLEVNFDIRYQMAVTTDSKRVVANLHTAIDNGVISAVGITPEQAARRLAALGSANGIAPVAQALVGSSLVSDWLAYTTPTPPDDPVADIAPFWDKVLDPVNNPVALNHPARATGHLQLIVCAIIKEGDPAPLIAAVQAEGLTLNSVKDLDPQAFGGAGGITFAQWKQVFQNHPNAIPAFVKVGTNPGSPQAALNEQTTAFVRRLAQFFNIPAVTGLVPVPTASGLPTLDLPDPNQDVLASFVAQYTALGHPGFTFGSAPTLDAPSAQAAAAAVFPADSSAAAWLVEAASAINALYDVANVGVPDPLRFSIAESLYARGFESAASIATLTADDFADALIGTVAFPFAGAIQTNAGGPASPTPAPASAPGPINDGTLANCVPPLWLSPLGPVQYLHDLWTLSESATCGAPAGDGLAPSLGTAILPRRGPLGDLLATQANLEIPLPWIDLVNECLEQAVATGAVTAVNQTSGDALAGHLLAKPGEQHDEDALPFRHDPARLFAALPEHSTPGGTLSPAYTKLRSDFSAPVLPYSQPLEVSRSYLHALGTTRFATMRRFRKDITEFVLDPDPTHQPADFASYRWRYPVRIDIAREYLGISPEEYDQLFTVDPSPALLAELYGFAPGTPGWMQTAAKLSEFLKRTGLSYCEFVDLWRSKFVTFTLHALGKGSKEGEDTVPLCEPCYPEQYFVVVNNPAVDLAHLAVFIRLWRKLARPHAKYTFVQLADIAAVLQLYLAGGINPDFVRQLAAFQMLRDDFRLELVDASDSTVGTGADRTHLLALFAPALPVPRKWQWAVDQLLERIGEHARRHHHGERRSSEFFKLLTKNLDPLSALAGFDPSDPGKTWHAHPTHALRFAEVLSKIHASPFSVGELLFLFTTADALEGDDPFRLPSEEESQDLPLDLPDDAGEHSLVSLRRRLIRTEVSEEEVEAWTWPHIAQSLREQFGFEPAPGAPDLVATLGVHFFPEELQRAGVPVTNHSRQYRLTLAAGATSPAMWNAPSDGPFHYDASAQELWAQLPLADEAVLEKLSRVRQLSPTESSAAQDLYFLPRLDLAPFAFLFPTFSEADRKLIQEADSDARWAYFQRSFAICHARCVELTRHLGAHVAALAGSDAPERDVSREAEAVAWRLLKELHADENAPNPAAPWESDVGTPPPVTWPKPSAGGFAALLGLLGTGLLGELDLGGSATPLWRELRGPLDAFGHVRNHWNAPAPMLLPSLSAVLPPDQAGFADVRNGIMVSNAGIRPLGGVEGYCVRWTGVLLVDEGGRHEFFAGVPGHGEGSHGEEHQRALRWKVTLRRGQKDWVVLSRGWPDTDAPSERSSPLPLRRGAYDIEIEIVRLPRKFTDSSEVHPLHTGFELRYSGPDTRDEVVALPLHRLFIRDKEGPLSQGLDKSTTGVAKQLLDLLYVSSLRDVRRTYQRAFKALLFARRFELHARSFADYAQSELGYWLSRPERFEGCSFYPKAGGFATHRAFFVMDFFPVRDPYMVPIGDARAQPSVQRQQALFDWWERAFDYTGLRREARKRSEQPIWLLFDDATVNPTEDPRQLVRYFAINASVAPLVLAYDNGFGVTAPDLQDERWSVRVWKANEWVQAASNAFTFLDQRAAHPDLWSADDPAASGGNDNLMKLVQDGLIENGPPRRYEDLKRLNDRLRQDGRRALVAFLCGPSGGSLGKTAKELSDFLLTDVEAGLCERASRIEEAITVVQTFERRARLGLEQPAWDPSAAFAVLWDSAFATFRIWQACRNKALYRENWIEWHEAEQARRSEGFRFLERELQRATLTVPAPGGLVYWQGTTPPAHDGLQLLQAREPAIIQRLPAKQPPAQEEGLNLLGTPERSARRSWVAAIPGQVTPPTTGGDTATRLSSTAVVGTSLKSSAKLPLWVEAAIRLGVGFLRVAGAAIPPASNPFEPRRDPNATERDVCSPTPAEAGCCCLCGRRHEAVVDEYYFWLIDSRYFDVSDASRDPNANWDDDPGSNNQDLPKLLSWTSKPSVVLMWARMHDGELMQPRRSTESLPVDPAQKPWDLALSGRTADSLYFTVTGALTAPLGYAATPAPGFRYDIATDSALTMPRVAPEPAPVASIGGLPAYPFFAYFAPGAPLLPLSMFSESVAVASTLRNHCRFEAALRWYELFYDPLTNDVRWCWESVPISPPAIDTQPSELRSLVLDRVPDPSTTACCRFSCATDEVAQHRAITLDYIETLVDWGSAVMRADNPESAQQARVIFATASKILGPTPRTLLDEIDPSTPPPTVATLHGVGVPLNPRLLALYDRVSDKFRTLHACLDAERLRRDRARTSASYWGEDRGQRYVYDHVCCGAGCACHEEACGTPADWCCLESPYRFSFLVQKAIELASEVRGFGANLLSAFEKGDAEHVAYVRANHERQLVELAMSTRKDAWRAADWDVQALKKAKELAQNQLQYYTALIAAGLNSGEVDYQGLTDGSTGALTAAIVSETVATILGVIPDVFVGTSDFVQLPIGSKLAGVFQGIGGISHTTSSILSTNAGLRLTESGWDRREAEWHHQVDVFTITIEQIERQILAAERRRDSAVHDLNDARRRVEQSREVLNLQRDEFTNHQLYLYLQREMIALHHQMHELALRAARHAQTAFNFERGYTARSLLPSDGCHDLREGLLAGERLSLCLRNMEKAYCDENVREYELTKHISLRQLFARQFLKLKTTGRCEIELPEWLFDLDYPGQYMRRLRSVALTLPCVVGPYTGVHCRLTLLGSATRIVPWLLEPIEHCCKDVHEPPPLPPPPCGCWKPHAHTVHPKRQHSTDQGYDARSEDPRVIWRHGAKQAIATSSGQNDAGLFELNFRDERYLPFEFEGAVSRWRVELPAENNYFDIETLSDVIFHMNYTAREGGDVLRSAARAATDQRLPDAGQRVFDVRQEFSDAWRRFEAQRPDGENEHRHLELRIGRDMFLFLPGHRDVSVTEIEVSFAAPDAEPGKHIEVEFVSGHKRGCEHAHREHVQAFRAVASAEWPGLYKGVINVHLGPLGWREPDLVGALRFPRSHGAIRDLRIVCGYRTSARTDRSPRHNTAGGPHSFGHFPLDT